MQTLEPNVSLITHMLMALVLGWAVGYERFFHARASGSQIYCLVSVASCALTQVMGYSAQWFGGDNHLGDISPSSVIGSILTGIGFLGAGIIVKSGTSTRGLTTAASIWSSTAVGILVGLNFYIAAAALTTLLIACMGLLPRLETRLPGHAALAVTLRYRTGQVPRQEDVHEFLKKRSWSLLPGSLSVSFDGTRHELQFIIISESTAQAQALSRVSTELSELAQVESFTLAQSSRA